MWRGVPSWASGGEPTGQWGRKDTKLLNSLLEIHLQGKASWKNKLGLRRKWLWSGACGRGWGWAWPTCRVGPGGRWRPRAMAASGFLWEGWHNDLLKGMSLILHSRGPAGVDRLFCGLWPLLEVSCQMQLHGRSTAWGCARLGPPQQKYSVM